MSEMITYTPTAGLSSAKRTQAGYYSAIKTWVQEMMETFGKWFDITYTDDSYTITFTPKDVNIAFFHMDLIISNDVTSKAIYNGTSYETRKHSTNNYANDVSFYVYNDNIGNFFIGFDSYKVVYGIAVGTHFGTNEKSSMAVVNGSSYLYFCVSGTTYASSLSNDFNRIADGVTDVYRIQPMPINGTDIVFDSVYYFDGGMSNPPAGVFKVGADKYCTLKANMAVKLT